MTKGKYINIQGKEIFVTQQMLNDYTNMHIYSNFLNLAFHSAFYMPGGCADYTGNSWRIVVEVIRKFGYDIEITFHSLTNSVSVSAVKDNKVFVKTVGGNHDFGNLLCRLALFLYLDADDEQI